MEGKHTPGPWRLDYPDCWGGAFVESADTSKGSPLICSLYARQSAFPPDDHEKHANGRLIAAAPELLSELQKAHQIILNALALMSTNQKSEWAKANARDGVIGDGTTRFHERSEAITKAKGRHE